jgi:large repetitive protein
VTRRRLAALALGTVAALATAAPGAAADAATYAGTVAATPGMTDYWRLGEQPGTTTAADATGTAALGTYVGATLGVTGALSGDADTAARFAGSGYVNAGDGPALTGPMTVEAWVSTDRVRSAYLVSDGTSSTTGYHLWLASNAAPAFTLRMTTGIVQVQAPAAITTNAWHHLVATVDGSTVTLYVDGAVAASAPALGAPRASAGALMLGRQSPSGRNLTGALDEVALYGTALDAATVAAHYALGADTRPPVTTIRSAPAPLTSNATAPLSFSGKAGATYECRLDAAAWTACASPVTYPRLADGAHTFAVRARDRYGIAETAPPARTWTVDTTPADTRAVAILPSAVQPTATVTFSATDPAAGFQCRVDGGARAACASPLTAPAAHVLAVRAVDAAGNVDATPSTVAIPGAPAASAALTGPTAAFVFWTDGTGRPECNLDGGQWTPCGATLQTGALAPGAHALAVRASLPDGAVQTATTSWLVSLPAPRLVGVQLPVLVYLPPAHKISKTFPASRLPAVRFSLNVGAIVRLSLDRTTGRRTGRHLSSWTVAANAGANVVRIPLAVYRRLGEARYRLTVDADGAAGRSPTRTVRFQVVRRIHH